MNNVIFKKQGWVGVDLDGTLARYDGWISIEHIGEPIEKMLTVVLNMINEGVDVRIFTARCMDQSAIPFIETWCKKYIGKILPITNIKDYDMLCLYDGRAIPVKFNEGPINVNLRNSY